jgi:hypothetical protein
MSLLDNNGELRLIVAIVRQALEDAVVVDKNCKHLAAGARRWLLESGDKNAGGSAKLSDCEAFLVSLNVNPVKFRAGLIKMLRTKASRLKLRQRLRHFEKPRKRAA